MSQTPVILDPPKWFWSIIHSAAGDPRRLRSGIWVMDEESFGLLYAYWRDLATQLTAPRYRKYMAQGISDRGEFDIGAWVVGQGGTTTGRSPRILRPCQPMPSRVPATSVNCSTP